MPSVIIPGDFIISGWRYDGRPLSFPVENGAHGGPGLHETHGVAILPSACQSVTSDRGYLRAGDLHKLALAYLGRAVPEGPPEVAASPKPSGKSQLRVMTYNVHGCRGMDNLISPQRIAEIIAEHQPDVVCLQELDAGRARSQGHDQARLIAKYLNMTCHYHPAMQVGDEQYGNPVLSCYPCRLVKCQRLPGLPGRPELEPRGVLWVEVQKDGVAWNILSTHLGLSARDRRIQVQALLGDQWLGNARCRERVVLCGDLNMHRGSFSYRRLCQVLQDAQNSRGRMRHRATWSSIWPCRILDYLLVSKDVSVQGCWVSRTTQARLSSDHLPLVADLSAKRQDADESSCLV